MRRIALSIVLTLMGLAPLPVSAAERTWHNAPGELPGIWDSRLSDEDRQVLLNLEVLIPEEVDPVHETPNEVLVLPKLEQTGISAVFDFGPRSRYQAMKRALDEIQRLPMFPLVNSLQRQIAAIRFLENLLTQVAAAERPSVEEKLAEARMRAEAYRAALNQRPPSLIEMAILRRSHRIFIAAGMSPPPIERYAREWTTWIPSMMNETFSAIQFAVSPRLSTEARQTLARLQTVVPNLQWYEGEIRTLYPRLPSGLSQLDVGFRARIMARDNGSFVVIADLNYSGMQSLQQRAGEVQYLSVSFSADVVGGQRSASNVSLPDSLCFVTQSDGDQRISVKPCSRVSTAAADLLVRSAVVPTGPRCDLAFNIGQGEGSDIFYSLADASENCAMRASEIWSEAHTTLAFLINSNRFPPVAGLEDVQPCRLNGQIAGIDKARDAYALRCGSGGP